MQAVQALRNFTPPAFKRWYRWLMRPAYRYTEREFKRLSLLPRYQPTSTRLLGEPLDVVDAASFLFMYGEIFKQQIYSFEAGSQSPLIIDGGANIGLSTIYFKQLYPQCRVIAFEPDADVFPVLANNIRRRGYRDVELRQRALWSSETALSFMAEGADGGRIAQSGDPRNIVVQTVRLRDHLDRPVDLLKLDIEGAETEVIADCADLLHNVRHLFVEYHSFEAKPQTLRQLVDCLADAGFRLHFQSINASPQPFLRRNLCLGMDMQLNIFAFRV